MIRFFGPAHQKLCEFRRIVDHYLYTYFCPRPLLSSLELSSYIEDQNWFHISHTIPKNKEKEKKKESVCDHRPQHQHTLRLLCDVPTMYTEPNLSLMSTLPSSSTTSLWTCAWSLTSTTTTTRSPWRSQPPGWSCRRTRLLGSRPPNSQPLQERWDRTGNQWQKQNLGSWIKTNECLHTYFIENWTATPSPE